MAINPVPANKIVSFQGDAIIVQMRNVPATTNEVSLVITRNGAHETRFTVTELQSVLTEANNLLRQRAAPPAQKGQA